MTKSKTFVGPPMIDGPEGTCTKCGRVVALLNSGHARRHPEQSSSVHGYYTVCDGSLKLPVEAVENLR